MADAAAVLCGEWRRMVAWWFATFCLVLIAPAIAAPARAGDGEYQVIGDDLEYMTEPTHSAYSTGCLKRGDRIMAKKTQPGWIQVQTPPDHFHWINAAEVEEQPDGTCIVIKRQASIRFAAESARLPGPIVRTVRKGTVVRPIDHPDLKVEASGKTQTWLAIEATDDSTRYVATDKLEPIGLASSPPRPERSEQLAVYLPSDDDNVPPEVKAELASIAAMNRSIQAASVETWNLDPIRGRYESLLRQFDANPAVRRAIEPRLDLVRRDMELVRSLQAVARLLKAGDDRDAAIARTQRSVALARSGSDRGYDAQGLLQPSSRRSQGQKVLALVGPEGRTTSYLAIPPGVSVGRYLAHRVGVRGVVHFDEGLGARLISVRDLELIEPRR